MSYVRKKYLVYNVYNRTNVLLGLKTTIVWNLRKAKLKSSPFCDENFNYARF